MFVVGVLDQPIVFRVSPFLMVNPSPCEVSVFALLWKFEIFKKAKFFTW